MMPYVGFNIAIANQYFDEADVSSSNPIKNYVKILYATLSKAASQIQFLSVSQNNAIVRDN